MYIHRIILKDYRNFENLDLLLKNAWTEQPLQSVLLTGPNGSGKTTLLRALADLWQQFGDWLSLQPLRSAQSSDDAVIQHQLVAIEIRDLQPFPVWLFSASNLGAVSEFLPHDASAYWIGISDDWNNTPHIYHNGKLLAERRLDWLEHLHEQKERLQLGVNGALLPNMVFLEAETRTVIAPQNGHKRAVQPEPFYEWLVRYEARERWDGHLESMLRNLKIRDVDLFQRVLRNVNRFFDGKKQLTDFNDQLRLMVEIMSHDPSKRHLIDDLSAGERQCLILMFMVSRWLMPGGVVLIDEPDLHLHVSLQRQFIHELEQVVASKQGQLIVTSHSPTMWEEYNERQRIELGQLFNEPR